MQRALYYAAVIIGGAFSSVGISLFLAFALSTQGRALTDISGLQSGADYGQFIGGFLGTIISVVVSFFLLATLLNQSLTNAKVAFESNFYKMLDYHFQHIASLTVKHVRASAPASFEAVTGKRVFTVFKLHLERLLKIVRDLSASLQVGLHDDQIIDIACIAFYYGLDEENRGFLQDKLRRYPRSQELVDLLINAKNSRLQHDHEHVGRANQTNLSSYFSNMYHLIKYVDTRTILTSREKIRYMNILRAQLSNAELWLLYFNVVSRFGRKWLQNNYIIKYQLIRNMPYGFCNPFDHTSKFPMQYDDDEENLPVAHHV